MIDQEKHAFHMGWHRAYMGRSNSATRRQFRRAEKAGTLEAFAAGWFLYQLLSCFYDEVPSPSHLSLLTEEAGRRVRVERRGTIEIGPDYRLVDGYAVVVDGREQQPYLQLRKANQLAKEIRAKLAGSNPADNIGDNPNGKGE